MKYIHFLWAYLRRYKYVVLLSSFMLMISSLLVIPGPLLIRNIFDRGVPDRDIRRIIVLAIMLALIATAKSLTSSITNWLNNKVSTEIISKIKYDIFSKILSFRIEFLNNYDKGNLFARITDAEQLKLFFSVVATQVLIRIMEIIFCYVTIAFINWILALIIIIILPPYYFIAKRQSGKLHEMSNEMNSIREKYFSHIHESLRGIEVIKTFGGIGREESKNMDILSKMKELGKRQYNIIDIHNEALAYYGGIIGILIVIYFGLGIMGGRMTVGTYIAFSIYFSRLVFPIQMITSLKVQIQPSIVALKHIYDLISNNENTEKGMADNCDTPIMGNDIEINNVQFGFMNNHVLDNISLSIKPGEKILIIGPNGSGKSTLAKLLLRYYEYDKGSIKIGGTELKDISHKRIREEICYLSQNIFLFNESIRYNILYAKPDASEDLINRAMASTRIDRIFKNRLCKIDTVVGEEGSKLSGGERQRIAIARAIIKDSKIVIFDEPTVHLDKDIKKSFVNDLSRIFVNKTCIFISHEGNIFVPKVDKTYTLKAGKLFGEETIKEFRS